jgi:hypothetical protein
MQREYLTCPGRKWLFLFWILIPISAWAQIPLPESRIVQAVSETALVTLRGNTHPLAQPQYDQGAAPPDLPMARMLLVLKRSDAQESALQKLLDDQQDPNSAKYHQWLTPDLFGGQFGPSDQDIQKITAWLLSHGFQITQIGRGRTTIEFSGTALQVQQAFHTAIHKYAMNGEVHWGNVSDPQIPEALIPVLTGVVSLHNFPKRPMHHVAGAFSRSRATGQVKALNPDFTLPDTYHCGVSGNCYLVGPYDFAEIYDVLPLWSASPAIDGTGQSIAIVGVSNINIQDVRDFRNLFGLPANDPQIILNGPDPGLVTGAETEADLDVEWSGAVATGATIKLVVSTSTNGTDGVDLSALYVVENNVAPVLSESFGECELFLGTAGNSFENVIRQQAAAEGITFITSSGDEGSATCDRFSGTTPDPVTHGLNVTGLASSPYGVAVGGTDFANFGPVFKFGVQSPYWGQNNDTHQASVLGYVPETTWNSSCTNSAFVVLNWGANAEAVCNNVQLPTRVIARGGGGGKSNCTTSDGVNKTSCTGGYAKPSWQVAPGVPLDGARDVPDVSLFASGGFMDSAYILCEADQIGNQSCSLNALDSTFLGVGGTSASAPAFAGVMALVNQFTNSTGQGNANYVLYKMASLQSQKTLNCNASGAPASGCIFNDVTAGTIAMPCTSGSPDCTVSRSGDAYGILTGYNAGTGYDVATGLGSVNAFNLVHNWILPAHPSSTTLLLNNGNPVSISHGQSVPFSVGVTPNAASGEVALIASPTGSGLIQMAEASVQNGAATGTTNSLTGGNAYQVTAHYAGDGVYAPSVSNPVTVTVSPEPSKTLISIPVFDPTTGKETGNTPTSLVYGSPYIARVDVGNAQAAITFPPRVICIPQSCPTGSITLADSLNGGPSTPLGATGIFPLDIEGKAEYPSIQLAGGTHQLSASFPGDSSYNSSSGSYALLVTPAPTQLSALNLGGDQNTGSPVYMSTLVSSSVFFGAAPTGQITFYDGTTPIPGIVTLSGQPGTANTTSSLFASLNTTFTTNGSHLLSAKYGGDANYAGGASATTNLMEFYPTTVAEIANPANINLGQSVTVTATVTGGSKVPPMTGTFQFYPSVGNPSIPSPAKLTQGTDANGNQILTATAVTTPQSSDSVQLNYSGDTNYSPSIGYVLINVTIPDFSLGTSSPMLAMNAGQSGTTTLTVTPQSNISSTVAVTCDVSAIAGASCSMNPVSPLSLSNGATASTLLTVTTLPPSNSSTTTFVPAPRSILRTVPPPTRWLMVVTDGLAILILSLWPRRKRRHFATSLGMVGLLCLVIGCGAGSANNGGGGGGGGGNVPTPTSLTFTTPGVKVQLGASLTLSAKVASTQPSPTSGTVTFLDAGAPIAYANVANGTASASISYLSVGTHVLTAQYSGDTNNLPSSTKGFINQVITGTTQIYISGATSVLSHLMPISVTIQ